MHINDSKIILKDLNQVASPNIAATIMIAHFNAAVEAEHLAAWSDAKKNYETALEYAILGDEISRKQMQVKIMKALQLVNMKVRNKVERVREHSIRPLSL